MTLSLPNVRRLFIPDDGYVMFEADLKGADAQVVAAEAKDEELLSAFRKGLDIHDFNAISMWGDSYAKLEGHTRSARRKKCKVAVHGTNYGASPRTIAITLGWSIAEASGFQYRWFDLHPGIREWHERVYLDLQKSRAATNKFGYRIVYFDRVDGLLPQALAWIPQSTVALTSFRGLRRLIDTFPQVKILLQVHDSIVFQFPKTDLPSNQEILSSLETPIPYEPSLTIPWSLSASAESWGACSPV